MSYPSRSTVLAPPSYLNSAVHVGEVIRRWVKVLHVRCKAGVAVARGGGRHGALKQLRRGRRSIANKRVRIDSVVPAFVLIRKAALLRKQTRGVN